MKLREIYHQQGGKALLKQYWRSGSLFTAIGEFCLLGKSRTALEILRLSAQMKTVQKLKRMYGGVMKKFDKSLSQDMVHETSNKVWVCWFQGMDHAPHVVQKCYQSIVENLTDRDIVLLTEENMLEYVQFPEYIMEKWRSGQITYTHMTDLLRLELLIKYGGLWIDATVLCTKKRCEIDDFYFDSDLFLYQYLKPGRDGHAQVVSTWIMGAKTNNRILMTVRHLCYEYWKKHNYMMDYFLLHDFLSIASEYYCDEWKKIVPRDNAIPHVLLLRLFDRYDEYMWNAIRSQTPFHKLTYKFSEENLLMDNTYYKKLIEC